MASQPRPKREEGSPILAEFTLVMEYRERVTQVTVDTQLPAVLRCWGGLAYSSTKEFYEPPFSL